jgi:hypothetical protein
MRGSGCALIGNGVEKLAQKRISIIDLNHYHITRLKMNTLAYSVGEKFL